MTDRAVLVRHPVAMAGVAITTASAVVFIALALAMFLGLLANPYAGLVVFVGLPLIFMVGLLLFPVLPVAWELWAARRRAAKKETGTRWLSVWPSGMSLTPAEIMLAARA